MVHFLKILFFCIKPKGTTATDTIYYGELLHFIFYRLHIQSCVYHIMFCVLYAHTKFFAFFHFSIVFLWGGAASFQDSTTGTMKVHT